MALLATATGKHALERDLQELGSAEVFALPQIPDIVGGAGKSKLVPIQLHIERLISPVERGDVMAGAAAAIALQTTSLFEMMIGRLLVECWLTSSTSRLVRRLVVQSSLRVRLAPIISGERMMDQRVINVSCSSCVSRL